MFRVDCKSILEIGRVAAGTIRGQYNLSGTRDLRQLNLYPRASLRTLSYIARPLYSLSHEDAYITALQEGKALLECSSRWTLDAGQTS